MNKSLLRKTQQTERQPRDKEYTPVPLAYVVLKGQINLQQWKSEKWLSPGVEKGAE